MFRIATPYFIDVSDSRAAGPGFDLDRVSRPRAGRGGAGLNASTL
jgi:hypothetical protein